MATHSQLADHGADTLARDAREFWESGWMPGTGGNLSLRIRDPGPILVTASGVHKGRLGREDFVLCGLEADRVDSDAQAPSAETPIHCTIYRAIAEAGAVYHVHHPRAALCSRRDADRGRTRFEDIEMIKALGAQGPHESVDIPIVENHADMDRLAEAVGAAIDTTRTDGGAAVMVRNHGFYAWGSGPAEAHRHVEALAWLYDWSWEQQTARRQP